MATRPEHGWVRSLPPGVRQQKGEYMYPTQEAITGKEHHGDLSSSYQALIQFYCAFNSGNMQMMSDNWAQSDDIAMDNPLGGIKRGWAEIQPVYERISKRPRRSLRRVFRLHHPRNSGDVLRRRKGARAFPLGWRRNSSRYSHEPNFPENRWPLETSPPSWLNRRPTVIGQVSIGCFGQEVVNA